MKKLLALILVVAMLPVFALADLPDISDLSESELLELSRQIQLLRSRINKLGPFDRAIVLLWLENLSYDEIGAIVGISAKNVSVRLVRIKDQLKKMSNE